MDITVLMGDANTERDVSLASGVAVADGLRRQGHRVAAVDTARPVGPDPGFTTEPQGSTPAVDRDPPGRDELERLRAEDGDMFPRGVAEACTAADVVVVMVYGDAGESGQLQAVLDRLGVPYVGPDPTGCGLSFDKVLTKRVCRDAGVPTAPWRTLRASPGEPDVDAVVAGLDGPWVVKPARGGSTVGTGRADDREELHRRVKQALTFDSEALVEQYVPGREFSVGLVGEEECLPVLEASTDREMFDYVAKYQEGEAEEICPAPVDTAVADRLQQLARTACRALKLGSSAFPRVDLRRDGDGRFRLLEVNGLSGMTPTSMYPKMARAAGMSLGEVCDRLARRAA